MARENRWLIQYPLLFIEAHSADINIDLFFCIDQAYTNTLQSSAILSAKGV